MDSYILFACFFRKCLLYFCTLVKEAGLLAPKSFPCIAPQVAVVLTRGACGEEDMSTLFGCLDRLLDLVARVLLLYRPFACLWIDASVLP